MGCIACYNGDGTARERSVMATHTKTELHYLELLDNIASGNGVLGFFSKPGPT